MPCDGAFVARFRELAELSSGLRRTLDGEGRLFVVTGETGIGKTRLARELAHRASEAADVSWGVSEPGEGAPPFWPWRQILRGIVDGCDPVVLGADLGADLAALALVVPELPALLGDGAADPRTDDSPEGRFRLCAATTKLIQKVAARRPQLLVLDDLQWADRGSLQLLEFVSRYVRAARVLVVGLYRTEEVSSAGSERGIASLARHGRRLRLRGLSTPEVRLLIEDAMPGPVSDEVVAAVHRATDGNPLLIEELVQQLDAGNTEGIVSGIGALLERTLATARVLDMRSVKARLEALLRESVAGGAEAAMRCASDAEVRPPVPVPAERVGTFLREGDYWTLGFGGSFVRLRDAKGLRCIALLLAHPRREIHVRDLARLGIGAGGDSGWPVDRDLGPVLDRFATAAYKQRLLELRQELEEARAYADLGRLSRVRDESDRLTEELAAAYGLGGRCRKAGDPGERIRKAVTNQIRRALDRVCAMHATLGCHLENAIRTGTLCSYRPEPGVTWRL